MAKFYFRLQGTLNLKDKLETQKKLEYGRAVSKLEAEKECKRRLESEKTEYIDIVRKSIQKGINPADIKSCNLYIDVLKRRIEEQIKVIAIAQKNVEKKRLELMEAMKERKKYEKLREKKYEQYLEDEKIVEQKIVDEVVSYKYSQP